MANSQFTIYTSADVEAPVLSAATGSLIRVLDYCLVSGSGWLKPLPNSGSAVTAGWGTGSLAACYRQPSGSGRILFVNDNGPNSVATAGTREAWVTGWETITSLSASLGTNQTGSVGQGTGQFPSPGQILNGNKVVRKSSVLTNTPSSWVMFVDPSTFYMFFQSGDSVGVYNELWFGDIFSFKPGGDPYKCMISARHLTASPATSNWDLIWVSILGTDALSSINSFLSIMLNRSMFGVSGIGGKGTHAYLMGDFGVARNSIIAGTITALPYVGMSGFPSAPNPINNAINLCPLTVNDYAAGMTGIVRGRLRGVYQVCHPAVSFADGQTFSGANDYAGKTFRIVKVGINGGFVAIETSNTVETN